MRTFCVDKKIKLSKFLLNEYKGELSFSEFNKLLRKKDIKINGKRAAGDVLLEGGERVDVYYDGGAFLQDHNVLFLDENVLCAVKPKGIESEVFFNLLKSKYQTLFFCHRLDLKTDGIMIFARNISSYEIIYRAFKERSFEKYYLALVNGVFEKKQAVLSAYLYKDAASGKVYVSDSERSGSKPIKTGYSVLFEDVSKGVSLVNVRLFTGRTHQIRAHLAHEGHFVLGDGKYGVEKINREKGYSKLMLTAYKLVLRFPEESPLNYLDGKIIEYDNGLFDAYKRDF